MKKKLFFDKELFFFISVIIVLFSCVILPCFIVGCGSTSTGTSTHVISFWVSPNGNDSSPGTYLYPFKTIEHARDAVRSLPQSDNKVQVFVRLRGGTYRLEKPIVFDGGDSGRGGGNVTYCAAPSEYPVICGSIRVERWSLYNSSPGIYRAYVGTQECRQLYVNGQRAVRARTGLYPAGFCPAYYYFFDVTYPEGIPFIPTSLNPSEWNDPSKWGNIGDVEAVILTQWKMMIVPLESVIPYPGFSPDPIFHPELKTGLIKLKEPGWTNANIYLSSETLEPGIWSFWQVTWFENAFKFLDEPGEWYLDRSSGWLYYIPRSGENLATADVELPVVETLIEGNGTMENPISNICFEGLTFSYATWLAPSGDDGYVSDQSGFHLTGSGHEPNITGHDQNVTRTSGNIQFRFAHKIQFRRNIFEHLGGAALDFDTGSQGNTITDNLFQDISSAAIQLGGVSAVDHHPQYAEQITKDNTISNNLITKAGCEFSDAAGIFIGFTCNTLISHNTIIDVPWSGIAMGWGWGLLDPGMFPGIPDSYRGEWGIYTTPTPNSGNKILNNRIEQFLNVLWDGGAIYTTGQQGSCMQDALLIEGNVAYNKCRQSGGNIFYTDGGSRFIILNGNVSYNNPQGITYFGPPSKEDDPLPYPPYSKLNNIPYGGDTGGCRTYGDINFAGNYWSNNEFFDICPFSEEGVSYPTNLTYNNNHIISGAQDVPTAILNNAGVHNFPQYNTKKATLHGTLRRNRNLY
ncbi:MAG: right-handed parallel beta-helix repeat-containing protein [bacterium]